MDPLLNQAAFCTAMAINLLSPAQIEEFFKQARTVFETRMVPVPMSAQGLTPSTLLQAPKLHK